MLLLQLIPYSDRTGVCLIQQLISLNNLSISLLLVKFEFITESFIIIIYRKILPQISHLYVLQRQINQVSMEYPKQPQQSQDSSDRSKLCELFKAYFPDKALQVSQHSKQTLLFSWMSQTPP
ncbi:hypothetical protein FGO68_gene10947 [Halteria grandinella]|uniref:Uncharacterized protein n=1 Tax=Halteria grandinella TaxID=5974 RepID=A0A8J8NCA5_HALGN|nr:hypothetical protein FGO68_gene10947 [Halteria grandinella]